MPAEKKSGTFKHIELIAYILAFWSFFVLFLEPIFEYYTSSYSTIEFITALANLVLLVLTILSRVLSREVKENKTVVYFDLAMLILGSLLLTYQAKFVIFFLLIRQTWFIVQFILFRAFEGKIYKLLMRNPPVSLMFSFAGVILIGTILLMLPASSTEWLYYKLCRCFVYSHICHLCYGFDSCRYRNLLFFVWSNRNLTLNSS